MKTFACAIGALFGTMVLGGFGGTESHPGDDNCKVDGARRDCSDWNSAHRPDQRYVPGCCYLPSPVSAGGRYAALHTGKHKGKPRVDSLSMFYEADREDARLPTSPAV